MENTNTNSNIKNNITNNFEDPDKLVKKGQQYLDFRKFNEGIESFYEALKLSIQLNGNNETNINCAKYFVEYAEAIIRKLIEGEDLFGAEGQTEVKEQPVNNALVIKEGGKVNKNAEVAEADHDNDDIVVKKANNENEDDENPDETNENNSFDENEGENAEVASDEELAFENLAHAEYIIKKHLGSVLPTKHNLKQEDIPHLKYLSYIYSNFGKLQMYKSDFKEATEFFKKALEIRELYCDTFSRNLAEVYFDLANSYDYDAEKCLLCYFKTKLIMEYHLNKELGKELFEINETQMQLTSINYNDIKIDRKVIEVNESDSEEVAELKDILNEIYNKIKTHPLIKNIGNLTEKEEKFTTDYDVSKVIDVGSLVKKRMRPEEKEIIKEENDLDLDKKMKVQTNLNKNIENIENIENNKESHIDINNSKNKI